MKEPLCNLSSKIMFPKSPRPLLRSSGEFDKADGRPPAQNQRSQLCTGTVICYALDFHYLRASWAGKSISRCQGYQTSMQTEEVQSSVSVTLMQEAY